VSEFVAPPDAQWRLVAPTPAELICHNDWAPWNVVFRDGRVAAMLDWDMAGPGSRVWDLANAAYSWVPLYSRSGQSFTLEQRANRLRLMVRSYGLAERDSLLDVLQERLAFVGAFIAEHGAKGDPSLRKLLQWDVPARMRREAVDLERHRDVFARALI
jgi:thiamine kinase-like enzyme